jgi:hypothetical protein
MHGSHKCGFWIVLQYHAQMFCRETKLPRKNDARKSCRKHLAEERDTTVCSHFWKFQPGGLEQGDAWNVHGMCMMPCCCHVETTWLCSSLSSRIYMPSRWHLPTWPHDPEDVWVSTNQICQLSHLLHRLSTLNSSASRPA